MSVLAQDAITITDLNDVTQIITWYRLTSSMTSIPVAPTFKWYGTTQPTDGMVANDYWYNPSNSYFYKYTNGSWTRDSSMTLQWSTTEPTYTSGDTSFLYTVPMNLFGNESVVWGDVSLSTSYEAAKEANNTASSALGTAAEAKDIADTALAQSVEYIVGTQTAATNLWTGVTTETQLNAGKTIAYKLPKSGTSSAATLNLTLAGGGTTGAKTIYWNSSNSANNTVTTQYGEGSVITMTYDGQYWRIATYNTDSNTYDRRLHNNNIKAAAAITAGHIICGTSSGYKQLAASLAFDLGYPLLYASAAISSGSSAATTYEAYPSVNLVTTGSIQGFAINKVAYLKGSVSGNTFTIASSNWITCTVPSSADTMYYIPLGVLANDATSSNAKLYFSSSNRLYAYLNGSFQAVDTAGIGLANTAQSTADGAASAAATAQSTADGAASAAAAAQTAANNAQSSANSAIKTTVPCYYRRESNVSAVPSKPTASTTIGTSPSTSGAWEYVMPEPKHGCSFFICEEYTPVNGTKSYSDVRELSSETYTSKWVSQTNNQYIDGGALYANSVTASQIDTSTLTVTSLSDGSNYSTTTQMNTAINTAVDNIEIGGTNLLRNTRDYANAYFSDATHTEVKTDEAQPYVRITPASVGWSSVYFRPYASFDLIDGKTITVSCDVRLSSTIASPTNTDFFLTLQAYQTNNTTTRSGNKDKAYSSSVLTYNEWVRVSYNLVVNKADWNVGTNFTRDDFNYFSLALYNHTTASIDFRNAKLEIGNKATDWSPAPEDATSYVDSTRSWYAVCSDAAATVAKTATITPATTAFTNNSLVPGTVVYVKFDTTNSAAVGSITLSVNGTTAKGIRTIRNNSLTTIAGAGYLVGGVTYQFVYDGTYWVVNENYNYDAYTARYTQYYNTIIAGSDIPAASIAGGRTDGKFYVLSGSGGNNYFDLSYPLLWVTGVIGSGAANYSYIYTQCYDRNLGTYYTSFPGGTANSMVYLVGTVSGNTFTLYGSTSATYLTCTVPTTADGRFYIPIGRLGSTSNGKNYFNYQVSTPVSLYAFIDGKFRQVTPTDVVATQKIYYRTDTSGTYAGPTTWVTQSGNVYGSWTTKVPPLAQDTAAGRTQYKYLYTTEQRQRLDGTVSCTPTNGVLDENTTVIAGGQIITNSITATQIAADTITANELNTANINASNMLTIGAINQNDSSTASALLNSKIQVGGRNLLRFTKAPVYKGVYTQWTNGTEPLGWYSYRTGVTVETTATGLKFTAGSGGDDGFVIPLTEELESDVTYMLSFDYRGTLSNTGPIYILCRTTPNINTSSVTLNSTGEWAHFEAAVSWTGFASKKPYALLIPYRNASSGWIEIKNGSIKLERGNKASNWSPAPEDIEADAVAQEQRIYYRSKVNSTPSGSALPTGWITKTTDVWNDTAAVAYSTGWTTKIPKLTNSNGDKYPYLYTCIQRKTVSGTVTYTDILLDDNTTVIDGGNIITGTVTANQISAHSIGATQLAISDTTNLIQANELYPDSIPNYSHKTVVSNGYLTKYNETNTYLMGTVDAPNNFNTGDELYYEFYGYAATAGAIKLGCWGYNASGSNINSNYSDNIDLTTTEAFYSGTISLSYSTWSSTIAKYTIGFTDGRTTKSQIYIRKWIVRRKNGGELIVDGAITANKLVSGVQTNINNGVSAYNRATAYRGTCATAAGTAAKVVTCANFELATGAAVTVFNTTANTVAGAITLNVNSKGAKNVYVNGAATSDTNRLLWGTNSSITFVYDGTQFRVADNPNTWYGSACSIAAATAAKTTTVKEIVLFAGTTVNVPMTYANTATSPTFNVSYDGTNYLGATAIYYGSSSTGPTSDNGKSWTANTSTSLVYDGKFWRSGGQTVIDAGNITTGSISADRIKANVISAVNNGTGKISADHIEVSNIAIGDLSGASNYSTTAQMNSAINTAVDNIEIGGKNLIGGTDNNTPTKLQSSDAANTFGTVGAYNTGISSISTEVYDSSSYAVTATETATGNRGAGWYTNPGVVAYGDTVTFSCMVKASLATTVHTHTAWRNGSATGAYTGWTSAGNKSIAADTWTEYSFTFTCASAYPAYEFYVALCFTGNSSGLTWKIAHAKLERGNKATDWSPAPEDQTAYVDNSIAGIEIGGRNLLLGTQDFSGRVSGLATVGTDTYNGCKVASYTKTNSNTNDLAAWNLTPEPDTYYTLSFWAKASAAMNIVSHFYPNTVASGYNSTGNTTTGADGYIETALTTSWQRHWVTWKTRSDVSGTKAVIPIRMAAATTGTVYVAGVMFEQGNTASNWSPAPEDTETLIGTAVDQIVSRGEQLVVNGNGFMGDNTNFSQLTFDGSVANNSPGSFTKAASALNVHTDEAFPVDTSKEYLCEYDVKSGANGAKMYAMLVFYDCDMKEITVQMVSYYDGSTTTLARELKNGDTTVYLTSASGFNTNTSATHQRALIFWNYTNSFGYTYPPETYSRNLWYDLWADNTKVDKTNNTITLKTAWNHGTFPAGTSVSQNMSGSNYSYFWYETTPANFPKTWTRVSGKYKGERTTGAANQTGKFWPGTAYCRVGWLWNYQASNNDQSPIWVTNVSVKENVAAVDYVDTQIAGLSSYKQINTSSRSFTTANWKTYGALGHSESWSTGSSYDNSHLRVGDTAYILGTISDGVGGSAAIVGTVTSVNVSAVVMTSKQLLFGGDSVDNASKTATSYITYVNSTDGIKVHNSDDLTDYAQFNSTRIGMYRNNVLKTDITDGTITLYGGSATYPLTEVSSSGVKIAQSANNRAEVTSTGMKVYASGYLKTNITSGTITLYGGANASGTYPLTEISSSAVKIAQSANNRAEVTSTGMQVYASNYLKTNITNGTVTLYGGSNASGTYPLTEISSSAVKIAQSANNYATVNSNGMTIYKDISGSATQVAQFGNKVILGSSTSADSRVVIATDDSTNIRIPVYKTINGSTVERGGTVIDKDGFAVTAGNGTIRMSPNHEGTESALDGYSAIVVKQNGYGTAAITSKLVISTDSIDGYVWENDQDTQYYSIGLDPRPLNSGGTNDFGIGLFNNGLTGPYIQATSTSSTTCGTTPTIVSLSGRSIDYDPLGIFALTGGTSSGVLIKKKGRYRVSASININPTAATTNIGCYIGTASDNLVSTWVYPGSTGKKEINCGPKIIDVSANTTIYLKGRNGSVDGTSTSTYLLIERLA